MKREGKVGLLTSNKNKYLEISQLASTYGIEIEWLNYPKFEIQSDSLEEIARTAAMVAFAQLQRPLVVEDTGLFIEALNGFPGPYTNYVRRTIGINGILRILQNIENRNAFFKTVVSYVDSKTIQIFTGIVYGKIAYEPRGSQGFGFDPIFIPEGDTRTFAELSIEEKNKVSHRSIAFKKFLEFYVNYNT
ncbi:MAG: XTP/dITP diphosphatase [Sulfolobaceae archaeon]|nr:XTP/dITP diphosphatase [Sulfolobaceae archaeon]